MEMVLVQARQGSSPFPVGGPSLSMAMPVAAPPSLAPLAPRACLPGRVFLPTASAFPHTLASTAAAAVVLATSPALALAPSPWGLLPELAGVSRPLVDNSRPLAGVSRPLGDDSRPLVGDSIPLLHASRSAPPLADVSMPLVDVSRPLVDVSRPRADFSRSLADDSRPLLDVSRSFPVSDTSRPPRSASQSDVSRPPLDVSRPLLDVWKSLLDDSQSSPLPDVSRPLVDVSRPLADVSGPLSDVSRPLADVSRPLSDVSRPLADVSRPLSDDSRSLMDVSRSLLDVSRPLADVSRPLSDVSRSLADVSRPLSDVSRPLVDVSRPLLDVSRPLSDVSRPLADVSRLLSDDSRPQADVSRPLSDMSRPLTDVSKPLTDASRSLANVSRPPLVDSVGGTGPDCIGGEVASLSSGEKVMTTYESLVEEAWQVVKENFLDARHHVWTPQEWQRKKEEFLQRSISNRMSAYGTIRSMLVNLNDPYTRFLTPRELKQLSKYDMTGIGMSLAEISNADSSVSVRVIGIVLGSPAHEAGVKQGDELLSVDGVSVKGRSAFEASSLIQGPKGTNVSLEIKHGYCDRASQLVVKRQESVQTPVYYRLQQGPQGSGQRVGYIRLKEFNAVAKKDLVTAINRLKNAGATSLLLDLQDNPGGLVQAGIEIAKLFLDEGQKVVYTVGRDPASEKSIQASGPPYTQSLLMVLVNDHTASASEIVAAALHDNCRAVLVGRRTFGKGLIQSVFELSDGSGVVLTVGKYVTPNHQDIDGNGIEPDFQQIPEPMEVMEKLKKCGLSQ